MKVTSRILTSALALAIAIGMETTAFAAGIGGSAASMSRPHQDNGPVHNADGSALSGAGANEKERESLRPYFESLNLQKDDIDFISCGGIINLKVGESIVLHTLQNDYALAVQYGEGEKKIRNFVGKDPNYLTGVDGGELKKYDDTTYCQEVKITGEKEGTLILLYRTNPRPWSYYKIVIGSGISAPAANTDTEKTGNPPKADTTTKKEKPKATARAATGDLTYTVQMGDTFGSLALNYFGDLNCWPAIYTYNEAAIAAAPNKQIYEGMTMMIPSAIDNKGQIINRLPAAVAGTGEKLYTVQAGDTYGTIALAHFGDMSRYQEIFNRNADRLQDINTLFEGQILVLPKK